MSQRSSAHDLIGSRFGRWLVVGYGPKVRGALTVMCRCECSVERAVPPSRLSAGESRGCRKCGLVGRKPQPVPGLSAAERRRMRTTWNNIISRCRRPLNPHYKNYGGRGIGICDEWAGSFPSFCAYMGPRPTTKHTVERINNDGNYEPGNVRWATRREQARNTRMARLFTFNGETLAIGEWADRYGLHRPTLKHRLDSGWDVGKAITTPSREARREILPALEDLEIK